MVRHAAALSLLLPQSTGSKYLSASPRLGGWMAAPAPVEGGADSGGCKHYRRKCDVLAPCCQRYFCCHMCHDEHFAANYNDADACSVEMKVLAFRPSA